MDADGFLSPWSPRARSERRLEQVFGEGRLGASKEADLQGLGATTIRVELKLNMLIWHEILRVLEFL